MTANTSKPLVHLLGTDVATGTLVAGSLFTMDAMAAGYMQDSAKVEAKAAEGKCGEGKCGMAKADTDKDGKVSQAEFDAMHPGQAAMFAGMDTNKDGFIDAAEHKASTGAKGAEGKCGEGKCGEGKCGGDKKTGDK